jgi:nucleoside-diphosphate-sugar epimerase
MYGVSVNSRLIAVAPLPTDDLHTAWLRSALFWEMAKGKRIFITGGTGFLGYWLLSLIAYANQKGADLSVQALVRNPDRANQQYPHLFQQQWLCPLQGSMETLQTLADSQAVVPFDYCIHAAADVQTGTTPPEHLESFQRGLLGVNALMELLNQQTNTKTIVLSSGAVYGAQPPSLAAVPESYAGAPSTTLPASSYGQLKRVTEWMLSTGVGESNRVSFARIFALIGPHLPLDQHFALGNFIGAVLTGKEIQISGDGTPLRSYLYAADACVWLLLQLEQAAHADLVNVGSCESVSIADLAKKVSALIGPCPVNIAQEPTVSNKLNPSRYVPDITKAQEKFKVDCWTSLEQGILKTYKWNQIQKVSE